MIFSQSLHPSTPILDKKRPAASQARVTVPMGAEPAGGLAEILYEEIVFHLPSKLPYGTKAWPMPHQKQANLLVFLNWEPIRHFRLQEPHYILKRQHGLALGRVLVKPWWHRRRLLSQALMPLELSRQFCDEHAPQ